MTRWMIDRNAHVRYLKDRVVHPGYAVNVRAVAEAMVRQAILRTRWRLATADQR
jgi:hypothetical protein